MKGMYRYVIGMRGVQSVMIHGEQVIVMLSVVN